MLRLRHRAAAALAVALFGACPARSSPIEFTGVVAHDFNAADPSVRVLPVTNNPLNIGQMPWITDRGWVSGWSVQDIRLSYDASGDTLYVGIDTFRNRAGATSVVGDSDGNGDPGAADPLMAKAGGVDTPHLGGQKSVAVAFAPDGPLGPTSAGTPVVIAGVPADKSAAGPGLDGFNVAAFKGLNAGLSHNFGPTLTAQLGALAFDPSPQHPGFEFTVKNFSKIAGLNPSRGFWLTMYAGSPGDVVAGETAFGPARVSLSTLAPQRIPEPPALVAWALVAGAAACCRLRRCKD